jgi:hypothetical protein
MGCMGTARLSAGEKRMKVRATVVVSVLVLLATGCEQSPPAYLDAPPQVAAPRQAIEDSSHSLPDDAVRIERLTSCAQGQVAIVHWNEAAVAEGAIRIWVDGSTPTLFAESAEPGSKSTGPWASPGTVFVVTNSAGQVIARPKVAAESPCD